MSQVRSMLPHIVFSAIVISALSTASAQTTWFVDDSSTSGLNNGSNWENAFVELQSALAAATCGDEIRVAQGTYRPDYDVPTGVHTGNQDTSFSLINGVGLYGGYAGFGAPDPDLVDIDANVTMLSGDLLGNDEPGFINFEENSHYVVIAESVDSTAIIDGFTITAGCGHYVDGGGMRNSNSSPTITNCTFSGNITEATECSVGPCPGGKGGGLHNSSSSPTVSNCRFIGNSGDIAGGLYIEGESNPTFDDCTFSNNYGSGASFRSGGMAHCGISQFTKCTFSNNSGCGVILRSGGSETFTQCTFAENTAWSGAGIYIYKKSPVLTNCVFRGNRAEYYGGAVRYHGGSPKFHNCTFVDNYAEYNGGGIYEYTEEPLESHPTFTNCILWGNSDYAGSTESSQFTCGVECTPTINHCCIQGLDIYAGNGNIGFDPLFVQDGYRLQWNSPCINAGDNSVIPDGVLTDLDGKPRIHACIVDMGAHEYQENYFFGDADENCIINLDDYLDFEFCLERFGYKRNPILDACVQVFDSDGDNDVDLADFAAFQRVFNGS